MATVKITDVSTRTRFLAEEAYNAFVSNSGNPAPDFVALDPAEQGDWCAAVLQLHTYYANAVEVCGGVGP